MAPVSDVEREGDGSRSLSREDCLCPICLEIFMEPVTLPCTHTFCKVCFLESVDKATLCCPLCRKRVGVWARQHSRNKSLVNEALWRRIQTAFPRHRLQDEAYEPVFCPRLSEPGALRQEYEEQVSKLTEERRELDEQERRASEELIQRLLAEEEEALREEQQRDEEDKRLALLLSRELNSGPALDHSPAPEQNVKKKTGMDRFLFPVSRSPAHSSTSNKENVLVTSDPPPLDYYGPHIDQSQPPEPHSGQSQPPEPHSGQSQPQEPHSGQSQPQEPHSGQSQPQELPAEDMDQSQLTHSPAEGGTKRKSLKEAESQGKRSCPSSCLQGVATGEWEAELQRRRKQEEEDLRLALELQRQLDRQERSTDRRKGSEDAYHLRTTRRRSTASTATATLSSTSTAAPSSSESPKPTSALTALTTDKRDTKPPQTPKSQRQTTLTDLFNIHQ